MEKAVQLDTILITAMGDGRRLAEIPHHDKRVYIGMGRDDLYALFQAEAIQQKNLHLVPSPAVSIARAENAAEVVLEDGQLLYFDEILGADGANGLCRSFVCGARLNRKPPPIMRCGPSCQQTSCRAFLAVRKPSLFWGMAVILSAIQ